MSSIDNVMNNLKTDVDSLIVNATATLKAIPPSPTPSPTPTPTPTGKSRLYVPLYIYPGSTGLASWQKIADLKAKYPTVDFVCTINPESGHFTSRNADFAKGVTILKNANVKMQGYVATGYAATPLTDIKKNIDNWKLYYPEVAYGIRLDEMANQTGKEQYYRDITAYAKSKGYQFVHGNPGTSTTQAYVDTVDCVSIYESSGPPSLTTIKTRTFNGTPSPAKYGIIAHNVPTLDVNLVKSMIPYVGLIYMTNDTIPNPWNTLPPYLEQMIQALV